jgi:uncharacterized protein (UPF0335 family)
MADETEVLTSEAQNRLKSITERILRLEEEKGIVATDIKEVYAEAKSSGHDVKALRKVVRRLKQPKHQRQHEETIVDIYSHAVGL